jgi:hypothetical protein
MPGKYILKRTSDSQFMFNLKASNGETILTSERYSTRVPMEVSNRAEPTQARLETMKSAPGRAASTTLFLKLQTTRLLERVSSTQVLLLGMLESHPACQTDRVRRQRTRPSKKDQATSSSVLSCSSSASRCPSRLFNMVDVWRMRTHSERSLDGFPAVRHMETHDFPCGDLSEYAPIICFRERTSGSGRTRLASHTSLEARWAGRRR